MALVIRNLPAKAGDVGDTGAIPGSGRSWGKAWQHAPVFLLGEPHRQRSLAGYLRSMGLQRGGEDWSDLAHSTLAIQNGHKLTMNIHFLCMLFGWSVFSLYTYIYIYCRSIADLQWFRGIARWFRYIYTHILFFRLFFILGFYKILTTLPCAIQ